MSSIYDFENSTFVLEKFEVYSLGVKYGSLHENKMSLYSVYRLLPPQLITIPKNG